MKTDRNRRRIRRGAMRRALIFLLSAGAAALLAGSCDSLREVVEAIQRPEVSVDGVELEALSFSGVTLRFDIEIRNPNPIGISLSGYDYDLEIEGSSFVSGEVDQKVSVEARGRSIVPLPVELAFDEIGEAIESLQGKDEGNYRLSSGFSFDLPVLGRVRIPVHSEGSFPILRPPALRVVDLELKEIALSGASLTLELEMSNRNNFKVVIESLEYRFRVNERDWASGMRQERVRLSENGSTRLTIPIELDFAAMGASVYQAIVGGQQLQYALEARVEVSTSMRALKKAVLPFDLAGRVRIRR
jgi:LEA14-like dessication related protein